MFFLNMSTELWQKYLWLKVLEPATSCGRDQDGATAPTRRMWEAGFLNWSRFMLRLFIRSPEFAEFTEFNESSAPLRKNFSVFTNYLSFETGRQLSPEEYNELGSARESWCAVERKKEQDWCRATRKHYPTVHLKSEVLTSGAPGEEPRCTWNVDKPTHKEKRHYTSWSKWCILRDNLHMTKVNSTVVRKNWVRKKIELFERWSTKAKLFVQLSVI